MSAYYIGLTGGIGSGKSAVCSILQQLGAYIIDADTVAREVTASPEGQNAIKSALGEQFFTGGELNRKMLRDYVFTSSERIQTLNNALSGLIRAALKAHMAEAATHSIVVVAIPLLFEFNYEGVFNEVWTVSAYRHIRIKRVLERDDISKKTVKSIMRAQTSELTRILRSDRVIYNNLSLQRLDKSVRALFNRVLEQKDGETEPNC